MLAAISLQRLEDRLVLLLDVYRTLPRRSRAPMSDAAARTSLT
jgi:hypothetical protein